MELLSEDEIKLILRQSGYPEVNDINWFIKDYSNDLMGYLGEHLSLVVTFELNGKTRSIKFFIKCLPRFDPWKADFLKDSTFFDKEYVMLSDLFIKFPQFNGLRKYRPKSVLIKEGLFVFEDVTELGYKTPCQRKTLSWEELNATISALAIFHSQSYIFEERKSKELGRPYRIWEEYGKYLIDPAHGQPWRDVGMKAVIDVLKVYSRYRTRENFVSIIEEKIPELYHLAQTQMRPSSKCRNVVAHRDIWSNNVFVKRRKDGNIHALIVDFQTVVYAAPMIDIASMIIFNTTKSFRENNIEKVIELYFDVLSKELSVEGIDVNSIIDKNTIRQGYNEGLVFGLTQAALIVPIVAFDEEIKKNIFDDPNKSLHFYTISRSQEFIDYAKVDEKYRRKICDLFDELLEKLVFY